jgi:tetratricopeptide (TPR) repeat protein
VGASGADYKLRYRPSVESKAALAGLLQGAGEARKIRLKGLLNPRTHGNRKQMAFKLMRSAGYDWPVAKLPLRLLLALALRRSSAPLAQRRFLAANYLTLVDSAPLGRSEPRTIAYLRRTGVDGAPAVDVRMASITKLRGNLRQARKDAERALAKTGSEVLLEAMAVYNLAWIYRQMGEFEARLDLLHDYNERRAHIGPNWAAWLAIDDALLALGHGDPATAAEKMESPLAKFSRTTINHPAYNQDDEIARALIAWHSGDAPGARSQLEASLEKRPVRRLRPALFSSLTSQILLADSARVHGDLKLMDSWLGRARSRAYSALQQEQIALVQAFAIGDKDGLRRVEREARQQGFGLIAATASAARGGADATTALLVRSDLPLPALY